MCLPLWRTRNPFNVFKPCPLIYQNRAYVIILSLMTDSVNFFISEHIELLMLNLVRIISDDLLHHNATVCYVERKDSSRDNHFLQHASPKPSLEFDTVQQYLLSWSKLIHSHTQIFRKLITSQVLFQTGFLATQCSLKKPLFSPDSKTSPAFRQRLPTSSVP